MARDVGQPRGAAVADGPHRLDPHSQATPRSRQTAPKGASGTTILRSSGHDRVDERLLPLNSSLPQTLCDPCYATVAVPLTLSDQSVALALLSVLQPVRTADLVGLASLLLMGLLRSICQLMFLGGTSPSETLALTVRAMSLQREHQSDLLIGIRVGLLALH